MKNERKRVLIIFLIIAIIAAIVTVSVIFYKVPQGTISGNRIAVIHINGPISSGDDNFNGGLLAGDSVNSGSIVQFIESASKDKTIKGIILNINSPGGAVVASKDITEAVKKVDKPVVALIREVGASGAYWVASAADIIVADPLSITGSIGVFGGYLEFSELMSNYGVEFHSIKSGKYKDLGNQFVNLTPEGEKILEDKLNIIHDYFVDDVNGNRKKDLSKYANGLFYLGTEAKQIGLIDELGGKEEAIAAVKKLAGITTEPELVFYKSKRNILDILSKLMNDFGFSIGSGVGHEFVVNNNKFDIQLK